jgi:2-polyprenyl-6-methoxyphenol hydroxylase-like FAD-dependent oxidoreductase
MNKTHEPPASSPQDEGQDGSLIRRVLITGGEIRGLTPALSLHQLGIPCAVFAATTDVRELGVGIETLPHSARTLMSLGLQQELDDVAISTRELQYVNQLEQQIRRGGRELWRGQNTPPD